VFYSAQVVVEAFEIGADMYTSAGLFRRSLKKMMQADASSITLRFVRCTLRNIPRRLLQRKIVASRASSMASLTAAEDFSHPS